MSENLADAFLEGKSLKNAPGPYFGKYGGRWMSESLIAAMDALPSRMLSRIQSLLRNFSDSLLNTRIVLHC